MFSRFYNSINVVISDQSQSNTKRIIDCDWSIPYDYNHLRQHLHYYRTILEAKCKYFEIKYIFYRTMKQQNEVYRRYISQFVYFVFTFILNTSLRQFCVRRLQCASMRTSASNRIRYKVQYRQYADARDITEFPPSASRNCRIILSSR